MMFLAYITWTTPWLLSAATLVSLPIAAHLFSRYARTAIYFPSLELIRQAVVQQSRWSRLRRWLLLLLRCLVVLAIVAGFARPVWRTKLLSAQTSSQTNAVVLLVDHSASMSATPTGVSLLEIAKSAAARVLDDLRAGTDLAEVVMVGAQPTALFGELSPNLPALRQQLQQQVATAERADFAAGLRRAGQLLATHQGPRRLLIYSDRQAVHWQSLGATSVRQLLPTGVQVTLVDLGAVLERNVSVMEPRHEPAQPLQGQTVTLIAEIRNAAPEPHQVRVTAAVGGELLPAQVIDLAAGEGREVSFPYPLAQAGPVDVEWHVDHDHFTLDDRCFWVVRSVLGIPIGVLSDDDPSLPGTSSYFLSRALAPHGDRNDRFAVRHLTRRDLQATALSSQSAVFVGYLAALERATAERLRDYVSTGGTLVIYCGQGSVRRNLQVLDETTQASWLPWVTGPRQDLQRRRTQVRIETGAWNSPLLRSFDVTSQAALSEIPFTGFWAVEQVAGDAQVLLQFTGDLPAMAVRSWGQGQVVLANFSPSSDSGPLGGFGSFVALTQSMAQNLRPTITSHARPVPGEPLVHTLPAEINAADTQLLDPAGQPLAAQISLADARPELQSSAPRQVGLHRLAVAGQTVDTLAVNLHPDESHPVRMSLPEWQAIFADLDPALAPAAAEHWQEPLDLSGRPLWGWMMVLALLCAAVEMSLLAWWKR